MLGTGKIDLKRLKDMALEQTQKSERGARTAPQ
jgi:hypothetical protein